MQKEQKPMQKFVVGQKVMAFVGDDPQAAEIVELHRVVNSDIQYARLRMLASGRIEYRFTDELREMQEEQQKEQKPMKEKLYRVFYDDYCETKYLIPWELVSVVIAEIAMVHGDAFDEHLVEILELCDVKVAVEKSVKIGLVRQ
jgi:ABC-type microcin C transport system duplicated ATPase subunit YejF